MNPAENILLQPYDVISVGRAEMVYVNGEVSRVGGWSWANATPFRSPKF